MMEYWGHWSSIWSKDNTLHGVNKLLIEKTPTIEFPRQNIDVHYFRALNTGYTPLIVFRHLSIVSLVLKSDPWQPIRWWQVASAFFENEAQIVHGSFQGMDATHQLYRSRPAAIVIADRRK